MKIRLVQMESKALEKESNLEKILKHIDEASKIGADLIIFPELCLTGYNCGTEFQNLGEPIPGPTTNMVVEKVKGTRTYVILGMAEKVRNLLYNSAPVICAEGVVDVCRKNYLPNFVSATTGVRYDETTNFCQGSNITIFDAKFGRVGLQICLDLYYPAITRAQALGGAYIFVNISAGPLGSAKINQLFLRVRAFENIGWFLYVNAVGKQGEISYDGGSCVVDSEGNIRKFASVGKNGVEEILEYSVDSDSVYGRRRDFPLLRIERPEILQIAADLSK